jgi:DnaK suppressor protein
MEKRDNGLDRPFIDAQRKRLLALHAELIQIGDLAGVQEQAIQAEAGGEAHDAADSAQRLALQENDEAQFNRILKRLAQIRRAIEKIDEGTYGLSDKSGQPIARSRLLGTPEALLLLREEQDEELHTMR